jgi:hypothetical protein
VTDDDDTVYLHEDDWGMIALFPVENRKESEATVAEAQAHGDAHRAPDGAGWTAIYVAEAPKIPITTREIRLDALAAALGPAWRRYAAVESGYSSLQEEMPGGFAFTDGQDAVYGTFEGDLVTSLAVRDAVPSVRAALARIGTKWRLQLVDLWRDEVVDLSDDTELDRYFSAE